jgi:hypothetical protein
MLHKTTNTSYSVQKIVIYTEKDKLKINKKIRMTINLTQFLRFV